MSRTQLVLFPQHAGGTTSQVPPNPSGFPGVALLPGATTGAAGVLGRGVGFAKYVVGNPGYNPAKSPPFCMVAVGKHFVFLLIVV